MRVLMAQDIFQRPNTSNALIFWWICQNEIKLIQTSNEKIKFSKSFWGWERPNSKISSTFISQANGPVRIVRSKHETESNESNDRADENVAELWQRKVVIQFSWFHKKITKNNKNCMIRWKSRKQALRNSI